VVVAHVVTVELLAHERGLHSEFMCNSDACACTRASINSSTSQFVFRSIVRLMQPQALSVMLCTRRCRGNARANIPPAWHTCEGDARMHAGCRGIRKFQSKCFCIYSRSLGVDGVSPLDSLGQRVSKHHEWHSSGHVRQERALRHALRIPRKQSSRHHVSIK
jgi:hypothetical protein